MQIHHQTHRGGFAGTHVVHGPQTFMPQTIVLITSAAVIPTQYKVVAGEVFVAGAVAAEVFNAGAVQGEVFNAGAVAGEVAT